MATSTYIFLESYGIKLNDDTIWGGGIELKFQVMRSESRVDFFTVYEFIGSQRIAKFNHDNLTYRQLKDWLNEELHYYDSVGMKLHLANASDWNKATFKQIVTENCW